jgi:hypothetical protein
MHLYGNELMNHEPNPHRETWDLIPWIVNGSATAAQRDSVGQHLRECADCREELALQQQFQAGMQAAAAGAFDPQPGLQRLFARIDAEPSVLDSGRAASMRGGRWTPWLAAAVIVQAIGLALLGGMLLGRPAPELAAQPAADAAYRTLSSATVQRGATIRLVVSPDTSLAALRRLLGEARLQIVESTADNAAFGLAPTEVSLSTTEDRTARSVAWLRGQPGVLLAEPIAGSPGAAH